jgi:Protein of unknown function (DUF4238)
MESKMAKLRRNNHYLPKCYQEGFTNSSGQVWVKFAGRQEPAPRNPKNLGRCRNIYIWRQHGKENDKVEDFFGREVETTFALLARRVKAERDKFSDITEKELEILARFVATQVVRTLAHRRCVEEQAGGPVDAGTFVPVMLRQSRSILSEWIQNPPRFHFYTSLPYVGEHFITGDNPILVAQFRENRVWAPTDTPRNQITDLGEIFHDRRYEFLVSLSPYVCVSVRGHGEQPPILPPQTLEPSQVRAFNKLIRSKSQLFTLARDRESLL